MMLTRTTYLTVLLALLFSLFLAGAVRHLREKCAISVPIGHERALVIDGQRAGDGDDLEFLAGMHVIGDRVNVRGEAVGEGHIVAAEVRTVPYYPMSHVILDCVEGIFIFLLGAVVFLFRPGQRMSLLFFLCSAAVALAIVGVKTIAFIQPPWAGFVFGFVFFLAYGSIPILFYHFTCYFPAADRPPARGILGAAYAVGLILTVLHFAMYYHAAAGRDVARFATTKGVAVAQNGVVFLGLILGLLRVIRSYRRTVSRADRRKFRLALFGLFCGSAPYVLLWILPEIFGYDPLIPEVGFKAILFLIPLTFAASILRYRLMDLDFLVNRSAVYGIVLGLLLVLYAIAVGGVTLLLGSRLTAIDPFVAAGGMVLVAMLFQPIKRKVEHVVDVSLLRIEYDSREAQKAIVAEMKECLQPAEVGGIVVERVRRVLPVSRIGLFVLEPDKRSLRLLAHDGFDMVSGHHVRFDYGGLKSDLRLPIALPESIEPTVQVERGEDEVFRRWGMHLIFPALSREGEPLAFLVLGAKSSGLRFTQEDVELLAAVAQEIGSAVERLNLQQQLILEHAETERLAELNRMKSYFVSSVSHDMKTPLTSIRMFAELLRTKQRTEEERQHYLKVIEGESERLTRLIDNVLGFARIERGIKEYRFAELDLTALADDVVNSLEYVLLAEKVSLRKDFHGTRLHIRGDHDALFDVIANLLSNAMKYSRPPKQITVSAARAGDKATLSVTDNGIGIGPEEIEHIFEPFYRTEQGRLTGAGGLGLGLSIVKHTVDAHHGTIDVRSSLKNGTTFTLRIPLHPPVKGLQE